MTIDSSVLKLSLRVVIIWIVLSILVLLAGEMIVSILLPYFQALMNAFIGSYTSVLNIIDEGNSKMIQTTSTLTQAVYLQGYPVAPEGMELKASTSLAHSYVPIVILYTALLAMPVKNSRERVLLVLLGVPFMLIILGLIVPPLLAGHMASAFLQAAESNAGHRLDVPFVMQWVLFAETGGRWLFPVVAAFLCKLISARMIAG
jgi:hypothetical protein